MAKIERGVYVEKDTYPTTKITNANQLRSGSVVLENDGFVGVVYKVYSEDSVSLCLKRYATKGNMIERDFQTDISDIQLIKY